MLNNLLFARRIQYIDYDSENGVLPITFSTGVTHHHSQVPDGVFQKLESATDKNRFYNENIYGAYPIVTVS